LQLICIRGDPIYIYIYTPKYFALKNSPLCKTNAILSDIRDADTFDRLSVIWSGVLAKQRQIQVTNQVRYQWAFQCLSQYGNL